MNKLIVAFVVLAFLSSLINVVVEGESDVLATELTASISATSTTIPVMDSSDFPSNGYITIGSEDIRYCDEDGTSFTVCDDGRGYYPSETGAHGRGSTVYGQGLNPINQALGFNIVEISTNAGLMAMPTIVLHFLTDSLPRLITFDYSFLHFGPLEYLLFFCMSIAVGFTIYMTMQIMIMLGGKAQSIIGKWGT